MFIQCVLIAAVFVLAAWTIETAPMGRGPRRFLMAALLLAALLGLAGPALLPPP